MRLRIEGTLDKVRVVDDETGNELVGVKYIQIEAGDTFVRKATIYLDHVAIDLAFDASRTEAVMMEDGKYAHSKLLDVARLSWLSRK